RVLPEVEAGPREAEFTRGAGRVARTLDELLERAVEILQAILPERLLTEADTRGIRVDVRDESLEVRPLSDGDRERAGGLHPRDVVRESHRRGALDQLVAVAVELRLDVRLVLRHHPGPAELDFVVGIAELLVPGAATG